MWGAVRAVVKTTQVDKLNAVWRIAARMVRLFSGRFGVLVLLVGILFLVFSAQIAQAQIATLAISKAASTSTPNVGDVITFTVTLTNAGPDTATNVAVLDQLPPGLTFVSGTPSQGTYSPASGAWNVGTLVLGNTATLTLAARVDSAAPPPNIAIITAATPATSVNQFAVAIVTPQVADLAIGKLANIPNPSVGSQITFTVTLTNAGPNPATNVAVFDQLPPGLPFVSGTPSQGTYSPASGAWNVGTLVPGNTATLTLTAAVASAAQQTNTATITHSDQFDPNLSNNSASATIVPVGGITTTTAVTSAPNPSTIGQQVTFTATVTSSGGTPTGTVTFTDSTTNTTLGTVALGGGGSATLAVNTLTTVGPHTITAAYNGNGPFLPSTGTVTHNVTGTTTTTAVTSAPNPSTIGQQVTFTATVTSSGGTPTGTVIFTDSTTNTTLGTVALGGGGNATLTINTLTTVGPHTITATYNGFGPFLPSTGTVTHNVTGTTTTTTTAITSAPNPSTIGQQVTFTATVTSSGGTPTGTVTFIVDGVSQSPVSLAAGTAAFTTSTLTAGQHSITASYGGAPGFVASTSPVLTQTVSVATTATALASSVNPSNVGQPVTFTATVTSSAGTPTGTVTFKDGAALIGTATLAAGAAAFTTSSLTLGTHTITATYGGTASFAASTSPALTQAVQIPPDSVRLRALQVAVTKMEAQASGAAFEGAVSGAIADGFADGGGAMITPSGSGVRFNFAADDAGAPR